MINPDTLDALEREGRLIRHQPKFDRDQVERRAHQLGTQVAMMVLPAHVVDHTHLGRST